MTIRSFLGRRVPPLGESWDWSLGEERTVRGLGGTFDVVVCFSSSRHDGRDAIIIQRDEGHEARSTFLASFSLPSHLLLRLSLLLLHLLAIPPFTSFPARPRIPLPLYRPVEATYVRV